jgi:hypothetical protein
VSGTHFAQFSFDSAQYLLTTAVFIGKIIDEVAAVRVLKVSESFPKD